MNQHNPDGECPGCLPVVFDMRTRRKLTVEEMPALAIVHETYRALSLEEKHAWHRVTCQNSRSKEDQEMVAPFIRRVEALLLP